MYGRTFENVDTDSVSQEIAEHSNESFGSGLGHWAVSANICAASKIVKGIARTNHNFFGTPKLNEELVRDADITWVRQKLEELSIEERQKFSDLMSRYFISPWLNDIIGADESMINDPSVDKGAILIEALLAKKPNGSYKIDNNTFMNVLEAHNYALTQRNAEMQPLIDKARAKYIKSVQDAVRDGRLPKEALRCLDAVRGIDVYIDDGFATTIQDIDGAYLAFEDDRVKEIRISEDDSVKEIRISDDMASNEDDLFRVLSHEFTHLISNLPGNSSSKSGLNKHQTFITSEHKATGINEAITEYVSLVVQGHSVDILSALPANCSYIDELVLLAVLCGKNQKHIPIKMFLDAYFSASELPSVRLRERIEHEFPKMDAVDRLISLESMDDAYLLSVDLQRARKRQLLSRLKAH